MGTLLNFLKSAGVWSCRSLLGLLAIAVLCITALEALSYWARAPLQGELDEDALATYDRRLQVYAYIYNPIYSAQETLDHAAAPNRLAWGIEFCRQLFKQEEQRKTIVSPASLVITAFESAAVDGIMHQRVHDALRAAKEGKSADPRHQFWVKVNQRLIQGEPVSLDWYYRENGIVLPEGHFAYWLPRSEVVVVRSSPRLGVEARILATSNFESTGREYHYPLVSRYGRVIEQTYAVIAEAGPQTPALLNPGL